MKEFWKGFKEPFVFLSPCFSLKGIGFFVGLAILGLGWSFVVYFLSGGLALILK